MSIRYKIFGAFSVVILLACGLAFYGIQGISTAGDQVVRLYDGPLMGINHARSAHAGLNEARVVMQRSLTEGATSEGVARFEKLVRSISEDLSVVRDRVQSASVKAAREKAEASLRGWSGRPGRSCWCSPSRHSWNWPRRGVHTRRPGLGWTRVMSTSPISR